jgi:hypothetical protein
MTLAKCPFCGGEAIEDCDGMYNPRYGCATVECPGFRVAETVEQWNRRASGWVKCGISENLPQRGKNVLVLSAENGIEIGRIGKSMAFNYPHDCWLISGRPELLSAVTHYMPLPERPEE